MAFPPTSTQDWMAETINATQARLGALDSGESDAVDAVHSVYNGDVATIETAVQAAAEELAPAQYRACRDVSLA